jgi:hypothetical protein
VNVYNYNANNLWTAYGVAIAVTLFSIAFGFYALYSNGVSYRTSFSTIVATARSHVFNEIMVGATLGAQPMPKDVLKTKLKFGIFEEEEKRGVEDDNNGSGCQKVGFGLESDIRPLTKTR